MSKTETNNKIGWLIYQQIQCIENHATENTNFVKNVVYIQDFIFLTRVNVSSKTETWRMVRKNLSNFKEHFAFKTKMLKIWQKLRYIFFD